MKQLYKIAFLIATAMLAAGCNYFPDETVTQLVSITTCDTDVNFRTYYTFSVSKDIGYLQKKNDSLYIVNRNDYETEFILNCVASKLREYCGFVEQKVITITPDLIVDVLYVDCDEAVMDYTKWWHDWHSWRGQWFYPLVPSYSETVRSYKPGTLIIDIKDLLNREYKPDVSVKNVWTGAVCGFGVGTYTNVVINNAITDCFLQTPSTSFKKPNNIVPL